jgi:hypothetical protein
VVHRAADRGGGVISAEPATAAVTYLARNSLPGSNGRADPYEPFEIRPGVWVDTIATLPAADVAETLRAAAPGSALVTVFLDTRRRLGPWSWTMSLTWGECPRLVVGRLRDLPAGITFGRVMGVQGGFVPLP